MATDDVDSTSEKGSFEQIASVESFICECFNGTFCQYMSRDVLVI